MNIIRVVYLTLFLQLMSLNGCERETTASCKAAAGIPCVWDSFVKQGPVGTNLPEFSFAGYQMGKKSIPSNGKPVAVVTDPRFGAIPDDQNDDTAQIQAALDYVGNLGGGVVLIPSGIYHIHSGVDAPFLVVRNSNIVIRGQGSRHGNTVLRLGSPAIQRGQSRLNRSLLNPNRPATLAVIGSDETQELARITAVAKRGDDRVQVDDSTKLRPGQTVTVQITDPGLGASNPNSGKAIIPRVLTHPFLLSKINSKTLRLHAKDVSWTNVIESIVDKRTVKFLQPLRIDLPTDYNPRLYTFNAVHDVGIENIHFESDWGGQYVHHRPYPYYAEGNNIIRSMDEQDYYWLALWLSHVSNCWIRDVTIRNFTEGIIISKSHGVTVDKVELWGTDGHAGVSLVSSHNVLVSRVYIYARFVHPLSVRTWSSGNVFTNSQIYYQGRDPLSSSEPSLDFHGLFPFENLFDNLRGFYVASGGDVEAHPHAGVRNTFWNIRVPRLVPEGEAGPSQFFYSRNGTGETSTRKCKNDYEHYPQSFVVGVYRDGNLKVLIENSSKDISNQWLTVEKLNQCLIKMPSLYSAQLDRHK